MPQSKHEIQSILAQVGGHPRHRFGQNFMIDQNLVRLIADAGQIGGGDLVIEVGPGTGTLTDELLARGASVLAVEIDRDLAKALRERFDGRDRITLIEGDALAGKHELNADLLGGIRSALARGQVVKLVANLPYNIASPLVIELLLAGVHSLAFTVQKEVALRLEAKEDSDDYGLLSVMVQLLGKVEILRTLPPQAFWPQPKVDSALVRVSANNRLGDKAGAFSTFLHKLFSARRKTLRKGLTQAEYPADEILKAASIAGDVRVETLSPEKLVTLFDCAAGSVPK